MTSAFSFLLYDWICLVTASIVELWKERHLIPFRSPGYRESNLERVAETGVTPKHKFEWSEKTTRQRSPSHIIDGAYTRVNRWSPHFDTGMHGIQALDIVTLLKALEIHPFDSVCAFELLLAVFFSSLPVVPLFLRELLFACSWLLDSGQPPNTVFYFLLYTLL